MASNGRGRGRGNRRNDRGNRGGAGPARKNQTVGFQANGDHGAGYAVEEYDFEGFMVYASGSASPVSEAGRFRGRGRGANHGNPRGRGRGGEGTPRGGRGGGNHPQQSQQQTNSRGNATPVNHPTRGNVDNRSRGGGTPREQKRNQGRDDDARSTASSRHPQTPQASPRKQTNGPNQQATSSGQPGSSRDKKKEPPAAPAEKFGATAQIPIEDNGGEIMEIDFQDLGRYFGQPERTVPQPTPSRPQLRPQPVVQARTFEDTTNGVQFGGTRGRGRGAFNGAPASGRGGRPEANSAIRGGSPFPGRGRPLVPRGPTTPRGRGRGRVAYQSTDDPSLYDRSFQQVQQTTPGGSGNASKNQRDYGKRAENQRQSDLALRRMTLASRGGVNPYLVPIKFVKALMTPSLLFMGEEEIFLPEVVDVQDAMGIETVDADARLAGPTAIRVEQIFHQEEEHEEEEDSSSSDSSSDEVDAQLQRLTIDQEDPILPPSNQGAALSPTSALRPFERQADTDDEGDDIVLVERKVKAVEQPVIVQSATVEAEEPVTPSAELPAIVEPKSLVAEAADRTQVQTAEFSLGATIPATQEAPPATDASQVPAADGRVPPARISLKDKGASTARMVKYLKPPRKIRKEKLKARGRRSETQGLGYHSRRPLIKDASDIDLGSDDDGDEQAGFCGLIGEESDDDGNDIDGGMDVDVDEGEYARFIAKIANKVNGLEEVRGKSADEESDRDVMAEETKMILDEVGRTLDDGDDESDWVDESGGSGEDGDLSFGERLAKIRARGASSHSAGLSKSKGKSKDQGAWDIDDEAIEDLLNADMDEDKLHLQDLLDANADFLGGKRGNGKLNRAERSRLFETIRDGLRDDTLLSSRKKTSKKGERPDWIPPDLEEQWRKDRVKKAANKQKRAEARREAMAAESSLFGGKRSGKKKLKIAFDTEENEADELWDQLTGVERQVRAFAFDEDRDELRLPPMEKEVRKRVHELAQCFQLKSKSVGKGNSRFTIISKPNYGGVGVNERKVAAILRRSQKGKGKGQSAAGVRHREGDVVGEHAKRIDDSNIGYRLLQAMGWEEGARIGVTGLEAPVKAVIKNTKLGLGASVG